MKPTRVLMCCTGNICRSPTAEGVLRAKLAVAGLARHVQVDSAGTHGYHVGAPPDDRTQSRALQRGYNLSAQRARAVVSADFERFDLVLGMDDDNLEWLAKACPALFAHKLRLLMSFAPDARCAVVPDPYYGGPAGFDRVLDLVEAACDGLVLHLAKTTPRG